MYTSFAYRGAEVFPRRSFISFTDGTLRTGMVFIPLRPRPRRTGAVRPGKCRGQSITVFLFFIFDRRGAFIWFWKNGFTLRPL